MVLSSDDRRGVVAEPALEIVALDRQLAIRRALIPSPPLCERSLEKRRRRRQNRGRALTRTHQVPEIVAASLGNGSTTCRRTTSSFPFNPRTKIYMPSTNGAGLRASRLRFTPTRGTEIRNLKASAQLRNVDNGCRTGSVNSANPSYKQEIELPILCFETKFMRHQFRHTTDASCRCANSEKASEGLLTGLPVRRQLRKSRAPASINSGRFIEPACSIEFCCITE